MLLALALVMLLPGARAYSAQLGWVPLWLLGLPAVAWWSLYRFRLTFFAGRPAAPVEPRRPIRRRAPAPWRRRDTATSSRRMPHAA